MTHTRDMHPEDRPRSVAHPASVPTAVVLGAVATAGEALGVVSAWVWALVPGSLRSTLRRRRRS